DRSTSSCSATESALAVLAALLKMMSSALFIGSPVHIGHDEIDAGNDGDQVSHHEAATDLRDHLQVRERGRSDARAIGPCATIADQIVAVKSLGGLNAHG